MRPSMLNDHMTCVVGVFYASDGVGGVDTFVAVAVEEESSLGTDGGEEIRDSLKVYVRAWQKRSVI